MVKFELKEEEAIYLIECLKWNKYNFEQKPSNQCFDKEKDLEKMAVLINKIKEQLKDGKI